MRNLRSGSRFETNPTKSRGGADGLLTAWLRKKPLMEKENVTETEVLDKAVDGSSGGHLQVQWWSQDFGPLTQSLTRY